MDHYLTRKKTSQGGFTIIELLVVIAIIAVLSGIFFGVAGGVRERSRISRAQSDLGLLAQHLEAYKAHYGDYPHVSLADSNSSGGSQVDGEQGIVALYNALNGMRAIDGDKLDPRQRAFIDRAKFKHAFSPSQTPPNPSNPEEADVALFDPWGRAYRYYYDKSTAGWENPSYVLYSVGESGAHKAPSTKGFSDRTDPANLDNIHTN